LHLRAHLLTNVVDRDTYNRNLDQRWVDGTGWNAVWLRLFDFERPRLFGPYTAEETAGLAVEPATGATMLVFFRALLSARIGRGSSVATQPFSNRRALWRCNIPAEAVGTNVRLWIRLDQGGVITWAEVHTGVLNIGGV
jgi:hypothetical protein